MVYLKIKETGDTLVCFLSQCETFWMVCLGEEWYPKGTHKNAWYMKGFPLVFSAMLSNPFNDKKVPLEMSHSGSVPVVAKLPEAS